MRHHMNLKLKQSKMKHKLIRLSWIVSHFGSNALTLIVAKCNLLKNLKFIIQKDLLQK